MAAVLWQYKIIALIKILQRQEILLSERHPSKVLCCYTQHLVVQWQLLLQRPLLHCVGAVVLISQVPGDWASICRFCKFSTYRSHSCLTPSRYKSQLLCIFLKILGLCYRTQAPFPKGILLPHPLDKTSNQPPNFWQSHVLKEWWFLSLEIFTSFSNHKAMWTSLHYVLCVMCMFFQYTISTASLAGKF